MVPKNKVKKNNDHRIQTLAEEVANSISHGIGVVLSMIALIVLLVFACLNKNLWQVISFSIYGLTLFFLYLSSTLYHSFTNKCLKEFFHRMDHAAIYLLIAGTYTPITLIAMKGFWAWVLFIIIWFLASFGVVYKLIPSRKIKGSSAYLYIAMGWCVLIAGKPVINQVPIGVLIWLLIGGVYYTFGVVFYKWNKLPFHHAIWHLFVLAGSLCHFLGIVLYLV